MSKILQDETSMTELTNNLVDSNLEKEISRITDLILSRLGIKEIEIFFTVHPQLTAETQCLNFRKNLEYEKRFKQISDKLYKLVSKLIEEERK